MPARPRRTTEVLDLLSNYRQYLSRQPRPDPKEIARVNAAELYMLGLDRTVEEFVTRFRRGEDSPRLAELARDPVPDPTRTHPPRTA